MLTTRHPVDFAYTRPEPEALFEYARAHDVEAGGRYDARSACLLLWSHHWLNDATRNESETIGAFYVRWTDPPTLWEIETLLGKSKTRGKAVLHRPFDGTRDRRHSPHDTHARGVGDWPLRLTQQGPPKGTV